MAGHTEKIVFGDVKRGGQAPSEVCTTYHPGAQATCDEVVGPIAAYVAIHLQS